MRKSYDFYETPKHYVDALNKHFQITNGDIFEPCVGDSSLINHLSNPLNLPIATNDLDPKREAIYHFNAAWEPFWQNKTFDWIVTNPPFEDIIPIMRISWRRCRQGIIFLARISFLEPCLNRIDLLNSLIISHLIFLPRYSFTGKGNDNVTCCWLIAQKNYTKPCEIIFVDK